MKRSEGSQKYLLYLLKHISINKL